MATLRLFTGSTAALGPEPVVYGRADCVKPVDKVSRCGCQGGVGGGGSSSGGGGDLPPHHHTQTIVWNSIKQF